MCYSKTLTCCVESDDVLIPNSHILCCGRRCVTPNPLLCCVEADAVLLPNSHMLYSGRRCVTPKLSYVVLRQTLCYSQTLICCAEAEATKVNGLKEVYSLKFLEPTRPRCQVIVVVIMSRCMNFTVFSFVMVSNNKKVCTICYFYCHVASIV